MSSALANASRLKPEIRLAQSISHFEADLSSDQKAAFRNIRSRHALPDMDDVMRVTAEIDRNSMSRSGTTGRRCFGPRFTNFLQAVQQFAALGDIVVGGSQNLIACGVWSLVRLSILSIANFSSYLEKVSTVLMAVGCSAPRHQKLAMLYPQSENLQSYLLEYFIVVVHLSHQLIRFAQRSAFGQFTSAMNDSDFKVYQSQLSDWANTIDKEINILVAKQIEEEATESRRFRAMIAKRHESTKLGRMMKLKLRVLDFCSRYDFQTTWKQVRKTGNTTLFHRATEYQYWRDHPTSSTLIYSGKLGSGKSVLLANMVDDLNLYAGTGTGTGIVAYFFCRYNIHESLIARTILGSLARQILSRFSDFAKVEKLIAGVIFLDLEHVIRLLKRLVPSDYKVYFVLDGLDECESEEKIQLLSHLQELQKTFGLLICISSQLQPDNSLESSFGLFPTAMITSIPDQNPDIETFIETELTARLQSDKLVLGNPLLIQEIHDALSRKHQGMFLWVVLQIETLCLMKTDDAIRQSLLNLPRDLSETFSRILERSDSIGKSFQKPILELVTVACRPLTMEELREALCVIPGSIDWNPERLINDVVSILGCCGSLVVVDEEELTIRLVHHSVKQFLQSQEDSDVYPNTLHRSNRKMADIIITYLSYNIFENQLSSVVVPKIRTGSAPSKIIQSTIGSSSGTAKSLALKLLNSKTRTDMDIGKVISETRNLFKSHSSEDFRFRDYAKEYWSEHVLYFSSHDEKLYKLLLKLFKRRTLDPNATDRSGQQLAFSAVEGSYETFLRLLFETGDVSMESKHESGVTLLLYAARLGRERIVRLLIENGAELEPINSDFETALSVAVASGQEGTVKLLLENGASLESLSGPLGMRPLHVAAQSGHEAIVKLLLKKGAYVDSLSEVSRQTPLLVAFRYGSEAVIELLIKDGADFQSANASGKTPLHLAADFGLTATVELLLAVGANVESEDMEGTTPLHGAVKFGHPVIVELLGSKGANRVQGSRRCNTTT